MKQKLSYYIKDIGLFFAYLFSISSLVNEIVYSVKSFKQNFRFSKLLYLFLLIVLIAILFFIPFSKETKYLYAAIIIIICMILFLIPLYLSGEHRSWKRKKQGILSKSEIKHLKEEKNGGQTNLRQNDGMSISSN